MSDKITNTQDRPEEKPLTEQELQFCNLYVNGGLECGLFLEKYPSLDMVSFGPTLRGVHSPDERMLIPTVDKFWRHLLDVLVNIPARS